MQSDDEVIVTRCLEGDQAAFAFLVEKYKGAVHAYAYHRILDHQEAQDIVQEVFIKAYRKLAQLKWPHRFQSWLYTIASNECSTWLREHLKDREQEVPLEDVPAEDLDELAVRNHSDEDIELTVRSAMETLPHDSQLVLSLYYMSDLSTREVAGFMGISPNNVGVKLHRARKQLGERLEKMIGRKLKKEKLGSGFTFGLMNSIRNMPIPSLPKPRPIKWASIPISIGAALLIGIIGFGISSGGDIWQDMPVIKPLEATWEVSLLPELEQAEEVTIVNERLSLLLGTEAAAGEEDKEFNIRRVWSGPGVDFYGKPSPDGRYLSYVNWEAGDSGNNDLAIYEIATGKKRRLTDNASWYESDEYQFALCSVWSSDGKQIAYQWWSNLIELCVIGLDGSKPRTLYSSEEDEWIRPYDWTPDGKQILSCVTEKDGKNKILLVSVADGSVRVLKTLDKYYGPKNSSWYTPEGMSFSPDGRYIVYDFPQNEDSRDISLMSIDGSSEIPLVEHPANDYVLGWAPDGRNILFGSNRTGTPGVWVIAVVDGEPQGTPELVKSDIGRLFHPMGFTRDGSFYYGSGGGVASDVYLAELDPETGEVLVPPRKVVKRFEGHSLSPDYSPDGKYLAYTARRVTSALTSVPPPPQVLCIHSLETGEERELFPKLESIKLPRWSPDCSSIVVGGRDYNSNIWGIYQIDTQTAAVTLLVPPPEDGGLTTHEWFPDGKALFYGRTDSKANAYRILVRNLESGTEKELYRADGHRFRLSCSPDGKWLAFINEQGKGTLRIIPADGGEPRELYRCEQENLHTLKWTPDGKYVLFVMSGKDKNSLWRIPIEGGEPQKLGLEIENIVDLSIHPDGQHIAIHAIKSRPAEIWVMENFLPRFTAAR